MNVYFLGVLDKFYHNQYRKSWIIFWTLLLYKNTCTICNIEKYDIPCKIFEGCKLVLVKNQPAQEISEGSSNGGLEVEQWSDNRTLFIWVDQSPPRSCILYVSNGPAMSLRTFLIVMCMMIEIQDLEGVQKRCPPQDDQHLKKEKRKKRNIGRYQHTPTPSQS